MSWWIYVVLLLAGVGGGITGSVGGLSSIVSYPVLLAVGLPPVTANVSNTVALVFSGIGAVSGSAAELAGQGRRLRPLIAASAAGGAVGSGLLLAAPAASFEVIVPWLIAGASAAILLPRRSLTAAPTKNQQPAMLAGTALIGVYGGYFGAAAGVLMLALILAVTDDTLPRANAAKNVLSGFSNAVAAVAFILLGPVRWLAVLPLAIGFLVGGRLGPIIVRKAPPTPLRLIIAAAGVGLAVVLGWQAYR
ncbi:MAG: sulfite exporter TauE/SafE family protein [Solirubrobacteraceae bacterium]